MTTLGADDQAQLTSFKKLNPTFPVTVDAQTNACTIITMATPEPSYMDGTEASPESTWTISAPKEAAVPGVPIASIANDMKACTFNEDCEDKTMILTGDDTA